MHVDARNWEPAFPSGHAVALRNKRRSTLMSVNLHFPEKLIIRVGDAATSKALAGIVVHLKIFARVKNSYGIVSVTSENGQAIITKDQAEASVLKQQDSALMDYSTPFEQCMPLIEVSIYSRKEVEELLAAVETFKDYWNDEGTVIEQIRKSQNERFKPSRMKVSLDKPARIKFAEIHIEEISP
jgi:hypothetical protein